MLQKQDRAELAQLKVQGHYAVSNLLKILSPLVTSLRSSFPGLVATQPEQILKRESYSCLTG